MTHEEQLRIEKDRMRFSKNTLSANLALLAILFDVFYFVSIYQSDVGNYYYRIIIGASILYNLVFMLAAFLASEGIKNYKNSFAYLLIVIGVLQVVRIFILPMQAHSAVTSVQGVDVVVMSNGQFLFTVACLIASAVCCLLSAVIGMRKAGILNAYLADMEKKAA